MEISLNLPQNGYTERANEIIMGRLMIPRIVITQDQYDEIMKTGGHSLDWDGSAIIWDDCDISYDGTIIYTQRNCDECRFRGINQFWGCCKSK